MSELQSADREVAEPRNEAAAAPAATPRPASMGAQRSIAARQIQRSLKAWRSEEEEGDAKEAEGDAEAAPAAEEKKEAGGDGGGEEGAAAEGESADEPEEKKVSAKRQSGGSAIRRKIHRYASEYDQYDQYDQYARQQDSNYAMEQDRPVAEQIAAEIMALQNPPDLASLLKFDALKKNTQWPQVSETCKSLDPIKAAKAKFTQVATAYKDLGVAAMSELTGAVGSIVKPPPNAPPGGVSPSDQLKELKGQEKYKLWLNATTLGALPEVAQKITEAKAAISAKEAELAAPAAGSAPAAGAGGANAAAADEKKQLEEQKKDIIAVLEGMAAQMQVDGMAADIAVSGIALGVGLFLGPLAGVVAGIGSGIFSILQSRKSRKLEAQLKDLVARIKASNDKAAVTAVLQEISGEVQGFETLKASVESKFKAARPPGAPGQMGALEGSEHGAHAGHVVLEGISVASHHFHEVMEHFIPGLGGLILAYKTILHGAHLPHLNEKIEEKEKVEEKLREKGGA